jgi:hypothetical protein
MTMGDAPEREAAGRDAPGGHEGDDPDREARVAPVEVVVEDDGWSEPLLAEPLGDGLFRMLESPFLSDACAFGDVVRAQPTEGVWVVQTVVHRAEFRSSSFGLTRAEAGSQGLVDFLEEVQAEGGQWSIFAGGMLRLDLPPESCFDAGSRLRQCLRNRPGLAEGAVRGIRRTSRLGIGR